MHYRAVDGVSKDILIVDKEFKIIARGIVSAHGDKCRGYNREWEEHGINDNRGSLLFLLTYTKEFGENEKHNSDQWVIDNYQKYLPMIEKAEASVLEHILDHEPEHFY